MGKRQGFIRWPGQLLTLVLLVMIGHSLRVEWSMHPRGPRFAIVDLTWVPLGTFLIWRWAWMMCHWTRALLYLLRRYPRARAEAQRLAAERGHVTDLAILSATYRERPDITRAVFRSVLDEMMGLNGLMRPPTLLVGTGCDDDDATIANVYEECCGPLPESKRPVLRLFRAASGKRGALASGLEQLIALRLDREGAFVLMDGDTELEPGALTRTLPVLRVEPEVAALTTNEHVSVVGPGWMGEWLHYRHGQRHVMMSSLSLSRSLLCLTGRFSVFRASVLDAGLVKAVREDAVEHWLWGRYPLLSGDDKSSWFYLLKQGHRFLYIPDAAVLTHERIAGTGLKNLYHSQRRWCGNMVRTIDRTLALGPRRIGWFTWWSILDQRLSMWTTLIGPSVMIWMLSARRTDLAAGYLLWVFMTRGVRSIPSLLHGRRLSLVYGPLSAVTDWMAALVKIWITFFPVRQFWFNRGARVLDASKGDPRTRARTIVAGLMLAATLALYVVLTGWFTDRIELMRELRLVRMESSPHLVLLQWLALVLCAVLLVRRIGRASPSARSES
ncbi:MAG TPA: glycosyltransferase [Polyangiaceae bacterium]|nr:glycosyltransferase [Polyangiaceae bacterium]